MNPRETTAQTQSFSCTLLDRCAGCRPLAVALTEQQAIKSERFRELMTDYWSPQTQVEIHSLGEGFLRDRLDFTLEEGRLGLFHPEQREITDLAVCPQLSPELQDFLTEFRQIKWPIRKGSVRLRIGPGGMRGAWLDFANTDVQSLFQSRDELHALLKLAQVEVGQRRKSLHFNPQENRFQLRDPEFKLWVEGFSEGQSFSLYSLIGDFSQTGLWANRKISEVLSRLVRKTSTQETLEWGSGIGTLTLPLAFLTPSLVSVESETRASEGLAKTKELHGLTNLRIETGNFQKAQWPRGNFDLMVINPPRAGVKDFFREIPGSIRHVIYMSCYPQSLHEDAKHLRARGFELIEAHLVDQFPQTEHAEWITLWKLNSDD